MVQENKSLKKVDYSVMSEKRCKICGAPLKQNVVSRNPHAVYCYVCFKVSQGKFKTTQHKLINGEKVVVKTIDFKKIQKENILKYNF